MAAYFDFKKKCPHINYDDVYVKYGNVANDKLVLGYSVEGLESLSIDIPNCYNALSSMNFMATGEKSILSIAQAIEQIVTTLGGNRQN